MLATFLHRGRFPRSRRNQTLACREPLFLAALYKITILVFLPNNVLHHSPPQTDPPCQSLTDITVFLSLMSIPQANMIYGRGFCENTSKPECATGQDPDRYLPGHAKTQRGLSPPSTARNIRERSNDRSGLLLISAA